MTCTSPPSPSLPTPRIPVAALLLAGAAALFPSASAQQPADRRVARPVDPSEPHLVVRLLPGIAPFDLAGALGGEVLQSLPEHGIHLLSIPDASTGQIEGLAGLVKGLPTILYAELDEEMDSPEVAGCGPPEEELVGAQQCTIAFTDGAPAPGTYSGQSAIDQIQGNAAHAQAAGIPLVVAVIDTGIELTHELFDGRIAPGGWDYLLGIPGGAEARNGLDDDGDGAVDEAAGHGSHVAGLVALADPAALILPLRVLDSDGTGSAFLVAAAIYDAVDAGAAVINLSLSTRHDCDVLAEALMYAEYHGVSVTTSAGNSAGAVLFPGDFTPADYAHLSPPWLPAGTVLTGAHLTTVSAVDALDVKPDFACTGAEVDLALPGVDVYSAQLDGTYAWWSGTSMSTGLASGSISFLLSIWGQGSSAGSVEELLAATADDVDPVNPEFAGLLGSGRVNLLAAANLLLGL